MNQEINFRILIEAKKNQLLGDIERINEVLIYYESDGNVLAVEIFKASRKAYEEGEISFFESIQSIEYAKELEINYLDELNQYNQKVLEYNYLTL
jgi:cobalt-zinc-cadmium resistance protein CzcA